MRNPIIIKTEDDVMASIERYESAIKDFVVAGRSPPNDEDKCNIIVSKLPEVIQDKVMFKEFTSFAELKRFLQEHTQRIKDLCIRPAVTLNAMDETEAEREQAQEEVNEAIQMMLEGCSRDEILAAVPKGKGKGKGGQRKGPTTKRCYTCQEVGHIARDCLKARAAKGGTGKVRFMTTRGTDTRTCYNCGKPGHIVRDCYSKPQNTAAVEEEDVPHRCLWLGGRMETSPTGTQGKNS